MRTLLGILALTAVTVAPLSAQGGGRQGGGAAAAATAAMPAVGTMAPDFTAPIAGKDGIDASPVTLSKLRGKVVILAFYPGDRTRGCTIELTKFTTDYAKLFGNDPNVVVMPISKDPLASHVSWAKDVNMPFKMISDTVGVVAGLYGSQGATPTAYFKRTLWVIGKDGKITYMVPAFNVNSEDEYTAMAAAIVAAKK